MPAYNSQQELIDKWYDQYSDSLLKYVAKMVKDIQQAEDLVHETFIKAYNYIVNEQDVQYPKTFLYRVAHNLTIDYLRKRKPIYVVKEFLMSLKLPESPVESKIVIQEDLKEIHDALLLLKTSYRQVIILRKIDGFSIKDTAKILNWSESKVKSTLFRALRKLETKLTSRGFLNELQQ